MKLSKSLLPAAVWLLVSALVLAQNFAPPPAKPPKDEVQKKIADSMNKLNKAIRSLDRQKIRDPWLAEVEIYYKAASWLVKHKEFYQPQAAEWTLEALDRGMVRAKQLAQGDMPWVESTGHAVVRAYRSRVDGSVQPYAVTFPRDYGKDQNKKWRLDVVLHGRDPSLTEVKFLHQFNGDRDAPKDQDYVCLDIYGRGNNAYRWAGETDVMEAISNFLAVEGLGRRDHLIDPARMVLRGFSMGGAGTWHLGLHRPDRWCVLGPGAGFTTTRGYVPNLGELTPEQEACLTIYDAVDYAENVFNVHVVAYAGAEDDQRQAARNIAEKLKTIKDPPLSIEILEAPGLKHKFPPEWQAKAQKKYAKWVEEGRSEYPKRVRFVTYTLKYPSCAWVEILGLERHYHRALVDAKLTDAGFTVKTTNVRSLHLTLPEGARHKLVVNIDNQELKTQAWVGQGSTANVYLQRRGRRWTSVLPQVILTGRARRMQKTTGLQGPIDDAFTESFLCVRGTGEHPWHEATQKYAEANLERFAAEWDKYMRGKLPIKDDVDVSNEDIASKHLILFGDPACNSLIASVLDDLPIEWTRETITVAGKSYDATNHVPVLIYPSPLNTERYVVLNSGHTFRAADFQRTNALLFQRLGDYAVLKLAPTPKDPLATKVAVAGLFDDFWQIVKK
jgi:pimeloyl-ACP methyl ester carboxylesterase